MLGRGNPPDDWNALVKASRQEVGRMGIREQNPPGVVVQPVVFPCTAFGCTPGQERCAEFCERRLRVKQIVVSHFPLPALRAGFFLLFAYTKGAATI